MRPHIFPCIFFLFLVVTGCSTTGSQSVSLESQPAKLIPAAIKNIPVPPRPRDIICADFNGDGIIDVLTVSKVQKASLLLNKGYGTFEQRTFETLPHNTSVTSADVDGDGYPDFVVLTEARFGPIFINDGKGNFRSFDPHVNTPTPLSYFLSSADLNGDGRPDFVIVSESSLDIMVVYNRGNLKFDTKTFSVPTKVEDEHLSRQLLEEERRVASEKADPTDNKEASWPKFSGSKTVPLTGAPQPQDYSQPQAGGKPPASEDMERISKKKPASLNRSKKSVRGITGIRHFIFADINNDSLPDLVFPVSGQANNIVAGINTGQEDFLFSPIDIDGVEGPLSSVALISNKSGTASRRIAVAQSSPTGKVFLLSDDGKGKLSLFGSFDSSNNMLLRIMSSDINNDGRDDLLLTFAPPLPLADKSPVQIWIQGVDGNFTLRDKFYSNGYAAYMNLCNLSEGEKTVLLSNIHEGSLTLIPLK